MANNIKGKVWSLDSAAGIVSTDPVCIHSIRILFTTAGAGSAVITVGTSTTDIICTAKTVSTSTANAFNIQQQIFLGDQVFNGLQKLTCVNVDLIEVITTVSR